MKVTFLKRRMGKTTIAIRECVKTGAILVVGSVTIKRGLSHEFPGLVVMTFDELLDGGLALRGLQARSLVIDDADQLLRQISGPWRIQRITLSKSFSKKEKKMMGLSPNQDY